jgi:glycine cleavage system aminomethyltransferase T
MDPYGDGDCGDTQARKAIAGLESACSYRTKNIVGWVVSGVLGAAVVGSFVMAYVRNNNDDDETARMATGGRRKRREFAVTPIVTPDGGGATLRFDW